MNKRIKKKKKKQLSNFVSALQRNKSFGYYWIDNQFKFGIDLASGKDCSATVEWK